MNDAPRYPDREALSTRVSSDEAVPDHAATALDRPRFSAEELLRARPRRATLRGGDREAARERRAARARRRLARWLFAAVLAVGGGLIGAWLGLWLAGATG